MDPMENINNAADALRQVAARAGGFYDDADVQLAQHQAAYDALAGNLRGVVKSSMYFTATIDPDLANPTNVDTGTFNTIKEAVDASPSGALLRLILLAGKSYPMAASINCENRNVILQKGGVGDNPVIMPLAGSSGANNFIWCFRYEEGGSLKTINTDVQFPSKVDEGLPWSSDNALVGYHPANSVTLAMLSGLVTGDGVALTSAFTGVHVKITLKTVTLDGPLVAVRSAANGTALIGTHAVTLLNGALLSDGGAVGTTILQN